MAWYVLRAVSDALAATRRLLVGASLMTWGRLATLVLFAGGLTLPFLVDFNLGPFLLDRIQRLDSTSVTLLVAGAAVVGLAALLCGSIAEFILVEALRGEPIRLVAGVDRWWRAGVQLFGFRLVVFGLLAGVGWAIVRAGTTHPAVVVPLGVAASVLVILDRLTVAFVVPIMLVDDRSLSTGWRALLPTLQAQWRQYVAYLFATGVLGTGVAIFGGLLAALLAVAFAVPFSAFGAVVGAALVDQGLAAVTVRRVVIAVLAMPYLTTVLGSILLVHVAPVAYLRYIALFVLGDTNPRYDPIPRIRAAVRQR